MKISCLTQDPELVLETITTETDSGEKKHNNIVHKYLENIVELENDISLGLAISEPDFFIKEPIYCQNQLILIGENYMHLVNLDKNLS